jgi:hypothetical protein
VNNYQSDTVSQFEVNRDKIKSLLENVEDEIFNKRPAEGKWSAAECIDHLVVTNKLYLEKLEALQKEKSEQANQSEDYHPRKAEEKIIGLMEPPVKLKVKTPSEFKPHADHNKNELLDKYSDIQFKLIEKLKQMNIEQMKEKITSPASNLLKLQAGETFFLIAVHDRRHIWQLENTLNLVS